MLPCLRVGKLPASEELPPLRRVPSQVVVAVWQGVIALTATRSPSRKPLIWLPSLYTIPTVSCPSVRFSRVPMAPFTVCTSDMHARARVVLIMASLGPTSFGMGFPVNPTLPMPCITNPFMVAPITCPFLQSAPIRRQQMPPPALGMQFRLWLYPFRPTAAAADSQTRTPLRMRGGCREGEIRRPRRSDAHDDSVSAATGKGGSVLRIA